MYKTPIKEIKYPIKETDRYTYTDTKVGGGHRPYAGRVFQSRARNYVRARINLESEGHGHTDESLFIYETERYTSIKNRQVHARAVNPFVCCYTKARTHKSRQWLPRHTHLTPLAFV